MMFIQERGSELLLGAAVPRYWLAPGKRCAIVEAATYFGPTSVRFESMADKGRIEMTIDPPRRNPPTRILTRFRHPDEKRMTRCEVNGKVHSQFDPAKEWVVLSECPKELTRIIAYYE